MTPENIAIDGKPDHEPAWGVRLLVAVLRGEVESRDGRTSFAR